MGSNMETGERFYHNNNNANYDRNVVNNLIGQEITQTNFNVLCSLMQNPNFFADNLSEKIADVCQFSVPDEKCKRVLEYFNSFGYGHFQSSSNYQSGNSTNNIDGRQSSSGPIRQSNKRGKFRNFRPKKYERFKQFRDPAIQKLEVRNDNTITNLTTENAELKKRIKELENGAKKLTRRLQLSTASRNILKDRLLIAKSIFDLNQPNELATSLQETSLQDPENDNPTTGTVEGEGCKRTVATAPPCISAEISKEAIEKELERMGVISMKYDIDMD